MIVSAGVFIVVFVGLCLAALMATANAGGVKGRDARRLRELVASSDRPYDWEVDGI